MAQSRVGTWGNERALRLPGEIVRAAGLRDGAQIELEAQADTIVIRRREPVATRPDVFAGATAEEWRALYAGADDWARTRAETSSRNDRARRCPGRR